jgi:hypothetical protein
MARMLIQLRTPVSDGGKDEGFGSELFDAMMGMDVIRTGK